MMFLLPWFASAGNIPSDVSRRKPRFKILKFFFKSEILSDVRKTVLFVFTSLGNVMAVSIV